MTISALHRELKANKVVSSSRQYLTKLSTEGRIPHEEVDGKKQYNYDAVVKALGEITLRPEKPHNAKGFHENLPPLKEGQSKDEYEREVKAKLGKDPTLTDSKVFLTIYQGKIAEQNFEREAGRLVYRDDVEQKAFKVVRVLRDQILAIPERLAGEVASTTDPREVKEIMYKEINQVLEYLSSEKVLYDD